MNRKKILNVFIVFILIILSFMLIFLYPKMFSKTSSVQVDKEIHSSTFQQLGKDFYLVFFGYVGCADVCTPRLYELSNIYKNLQKDDIGVIFVNLKENIDNEIANSFAKSFNKNFIAIQPDKKELSILKDDFKVISINSILNDYDINHSAFLYLIKKENNSFKIKRIFTSSRFKIEDIKDEIN